MSFYTSLTGLQAATTELSVTSNNIANAGTTGFKRADANFGDIFASTPLQKSGSIGGSGVALKGIVQQHTQGNIEFSTNALDLAITGDGYFKLKTSDGGELFTRNGGFMLDDQNRMVNSAGQSLQVLPVDSVNNANFEAKTTGLTVLRSTVGDFTPTTEINLGLNLPSSAKAITSTFNANKPDTYHKTTSFTTYGSNGQAQLATIYYVKTSEPTEAVPFSKWQTHVTIDGVAVRSALTQSADAGDEKQFINKFGEIKTKAELDVLSRNPPTGGTPPAEGADYLITASTTYRKFSLDQLESPIASVAAAISTSIPAGSTYTDGLNLTNASTGVDFGGANFTAANTKALSRMFTMEIDGSISKPISLTRLFQSSVLDDKILSGKQIATELTNEINKAFGDGKPFDLSGAATLAADPGQLVLKRTNSVTNVVTKQTLDIRAILQTQDALATNPHLIESGSDGALNTVAEGWQLAYAITEHLNTAGAGWNDINVEYDEKNQGFVFNQTGALPDELRIASLGAASNTLFGAVTGTDDISVAGTDGGSVLTNLTLNGSKQLLGDVIGNGAALVASSRRSGMVVEYAGGVFTFKSGTTGDSSSIKMIAANDGAAAPTIDPKGGAMAVSLFGLDGVGGTLAEITQETKSALSLVENIPTVRGQASTKAKLTGSAMGVDTGQAFSVNAANQTVTVVIDGITQAVKLALGQYNTDTFIAEFQKRINLMADANGKTVSNVVVGFDAAKTALTIEGSTASSTSFIQVIGSQDFGLSDVAVAFGKSAQYARINSDKLAGSNLYVTQNVATGQWTESVDAGDFDAGDVPQWTPIFLDRGEITFNSSGSLVSPQAKFALESTATTGNVVNVAYTGSTQYNSAFSAISQSQNGAPEGDLNGISIAEDGLISASYSNGSSVSLGKIVVANFNSAAGLKQQGDSSWTATADSGAARLGEAGAAGYGTIRAGSKERSNVDLTTELVDLIAAQRNFQANAKAIETNSAMSSAIMNIRG
jgi:flagellar hook-basal body protein